MDDEILILSTYVRISKYRMKTIMAIGGGVKIPSEIARESGIRTHHISNVLSELKNKELVVCINEYAKKGRLYRLTEKGKKVYELLGEEN